MTPLMRFLRGPKPLPPEMVRALLVFDVFMLGCLVGIWVERVL